MNHFEELTKVASINAMAFIVSFSELENGFRLFGLIVASIYTCMKIVQLIKHWN